MGLDISIQVNNTEDIFTIEYYTNKQSNYFNKHKLSRTFCNFMCRQYVSDFEPELNQIGEITSVDITPLYDMEKYRDEETIESELYNAETEEEKEEILKQIEVDRNSIAGNIDMVTETVSNLIIKLSKVTNLHEVLERTDFDTLNHNFYFSDFNEDKGSGYIGNNFGQDLRNFKRFLEYAKAHGSTTVYFSYG